ncbi:MAG TPA: acyltransferase domain-containing protein [Acidimicrobiales bacterium]|nr:acyltransferase domain-containing protein [Acidimicrobiales bacterium]
MTPGTLTVMAGSLPAAPPAVTERVARVAKDQVADVLRQIGFEAEDCANAVAQWHHARDDARFAPVLAQVVAAIEASRGRPTDPLFIWPDLDDEGAAGRLFYLYVIALCAPGTRAFLTLIGVPEDVIAATFSSFIRHAAIHRDKWGTTGVDAGWWQLLALRGELLEIGRLQYHYLVTGESTLSPWPWYDDAEASELGAGFRRGDVQFGLHVPHGPGFDQAHLDASLERARQVLGDVWPTDRRRLATCMSWLLDDHLGEYLDQSSNILAFQRRFTMVPGGYDDDADTLEFIFRRPGAQLDDLPQNTTLERAVVGRLRTGHHWRARTGWFDFDSPHVSS